MLLPSHFLRNIGATSGAKFDKRPDVDWKPADVNRYAYGYNPMAWGAMEERGRRRVRPEADEKGNLISTDYQFWYGSRSESSGYARCRLCGVCTYDGPEKRKEHHKAATEKALLSCASKVQSICLLLSLGDDCVACGISTTTRHWGLPLCKAAFCVNKFKFNEAPNERWTNAAKIAERMGYPKHWDKKYKIK